MNIKKIIIVIIVIVLIILLQKINLEGLFINNTNNSLKGSYVCTHNSKQYLISFDYKTLEYFLYVDNDLIDSGIYKISNSENVYFLERQNGLDHIYYDGGVAVTLVLDKNDNSVLNLNKISNSVTIFE